MAKNAVTDWDTTANNNTDISGINIAEFCPPSSLNDAIRTVMAQIAAWLIAAAGPLLKSGGTMAGAIALAGNNITDQGSGSTVRDGGGTARPIGFLDMPLAASTAGRVIALADRGLIIPATGNMTIPTNATTAFPVGSVVGVYNDSGSSITVAAVTPGTTTLRLGGSASTGTRTLAQRGSVILWKRNTDEWVALNGGIS